MAGTINLIAGDTLPELAVTYTGINIAGYTITFHIKYPTPLVKACAIVDAPTGQFKVTWDDGDLVAGTYQAEFQLVDGSGKKLTYGGITLVIEGQVA